jgi:hypothetical protein
MLPYGMVSTSLISTLEKSSPVTRISVGETQWKQSVVSARH